jgi:hypothetical protein
MKPANITRFSIVVYEGKLWMLENRSNPPQLINGDVGRQITKDTELNVVKWPAQLAQAYLTEHPNP